MSASRATVDAADRPTIERGFHVWRAELGGWRILCRGRPVGDEEDAGTAWPNEGVEVARLRQVHSHRVAVARPGLCGEADALVVARAGLAATVVTADCVPVVLVGASAAAAIHAGWRGVVAGVVPAAAARLRRSTAAPLRAWIGPAIGPCCYEVGEDVAELVVGAAGPAVRSEAVTDRPARLDLRRAVAAQLAALAVDIAGGVALCTRCHPEWLWSYRREGPGGGRIETFVWRR